MNKKLITITRALLCLCFSTSHATTANSNIIAADILYFDYEEFNTAGQSLNRETGFLPGIIFQFAKNQHEFNFSLHRGEVEYDGLTQAMTPHQTNTNETLNKLSYHYIFQPQDESRQPQYFVGASYHHWFRSIQPANSVNGLDETYTWLQIGAGFQSNIFSGQNNSISFGLGVFHTLNSVIKIDLENYGLGSPELELGNRPGIQGKLTWARQISQKNKLELGLDHTQWGFGKSNSKSLYNGFQTLTINEPRSKSRHTSFYIGTIYQF